MSTLDWMKNKIDNVKAESGEVWPTRSISANARDVDKLLAFVDAFDSYAFDLKDKNFKDLADARKALEL